MKLFFCNNTPSCAAFGANNTKYLLNSSRLNFGLPKNNDPAFYSLNRGSVMLGFLCMIY